LDVSGVKRVYASHFFVKLAFPFGHVRLCTLPAGKPRFPLLISRRSLLQKREEGTPICQRGLPAEHLRILQRRIKSGKITQFSLKNQEKKCYFVDKN
jgi:hypothetical protein